MKPQLTRPRCDRMLTDLCAAAYTSAAPLPMALPGLATLDFPLALFPQTGTLRHVPFYDRAIEQRVAAVEEQEVAQIQHLLMHNPRTIAILDRCALIASLSAITHSPQSRLLSFLDHFHPEIVVPYLSMFPEVTSESQAIIARHFLRWRRALLTWPIISYPNGFVEYTFQMETRTGDWLTSILHDSDSCTMVLRQRLLTAEDAGEDGIAICRICLEQATLDVRVVYLPCQHWYHYACAISWIVEHQACPFCSCSLHIDRAELARTIVDVGWVEESDLVE